MDVHYILVLFAFLHFQRIESLECYNCSITSDVNDCFNTTQCQNGQSCYMNLKQKGNSPQYTLGCINNQICGSPSSAAGELIGRDLTDRQTQDCHECCSTDNCNKHLCEHLKPSSCIDDAKADCPWLNSIFNICQDIHNAKSVCPKFCGLCSLVDGNWAAWSQWSTCDVTCENGTQTRTRTCTNPAPAHGGLNCTGSDIEYTNCYRKLCPVHGGWGVWGPWELCSVTCDAGIQRRHRTCSNPFPERYGDHCFGDGMDDRLCMPGPCTDGGWATWGRWSTCSVTCGGGIKSRSRTCTNPRPSLAGKHCDGDSFLVTTCSDNPCHCDSLPSIKDGTVAAPATSHGATATYTCNADHAFTGGDSTRHCVQGTWTGKEPICTPIPNIGCYKAGAAYMYKGTRRTTRGGITCQRWDSQSPHGHSRTDPTKFPDVSVTAARNYCRDPDREGAPWCYTMNSSKRWDYCGVKKC